MKDNMNPDHYILVRGMSPGGLQAVTEFFGRLKTGLPLSILIAAHLHANSHDKLLEIVRAKSTMDVKMLNTDTQMVKGTVYLMDKGLQAFMEGGLVKLKEVKEQKTMIDKLFKSMAASYKDRLIGMVLSGTGTDGAEGLKAISKSGGLVLVQEPFSALYQSLPRLAIKLDHPNKILPPIRLASCINNYLAAAES